VREGVSRAAAYSEYKNSLGANSNEKVVEEPGIKVSLQNKRENSALTPRKKKA